MAKVRRAGFGTVFQLEETKVGIGTTVGNDTFRVLGDVTTSNANVINVATVPTYKGFLDNETRLSSNEVDLDNIVGYVNGEPYYGDFHVHNRSDGTQVNMVGSAHTTLKHAVIGEESDLQVDFMGGDIIIDGEFTVSPGASYCSSVDQLTATSNFTVPTGSTEDRIHCHTAGSMRFNEDLQTLEFYTGNEWRIVNSFKDTGNRGRGILAGGNDGVAPYLSHIAFINIASAGDAQSFGDLTTARTCRATSSETRALFSGGFVSPTGSNIIDYVTIPSQGNAIDFGDSTHQRRNHAMLSSSTRAIIGGGESPANINVMDYVEIQTLGNALDFGDLSQARIGNTGMSSPVRGIFACDQSDYNTTSVEFIAIASKGNAKDFGELDDSRSNAGSASNGVRGIVAGGYNGGSRISLVSSCVMASTGNFISFGNLTKAADRGDGMCNSTRAIFNGGYPSNANGMDSIEFASGGSGATFGSDIQERGQSAGFCSDSHGGLGGF